jgi:hypothetical protein
MCVKVNVRLDGCPLRGSGGHAAIAMLRFGRGAALGGERFRGFDHV